MGGVLRATTYPIAHVGGAKHEESLLRMQGDMPPSGDGIPWPGEQPLIQSSMLVIRYRRWTALPGAEEFAVRTYSVGLLPYLLCRIPSAPLLVLLRATEQVDFDHLLGSEVDTVIAAVAVIVLLCYKYACRQQGHLGRERARCVARWRRRVAMDRGLCRSVRTGSASGRVVGGHTGYGKLDVGHLEWPRVA
jgi:hypothetical protein